MKHISQFIIAFLFCLNLFSQEGKLQLIRDVTIIPTHINQVFEHQDIIISDDRIQKIRNHVKNDTAIYSAGIIEGEGKFLMASMVDAHAHFPDKENIEAYFLMNLLNGVGVLRSMRGEEWHLDIDDERVFTPKLILASPPLRRSDSLSIEKQSSMVKTYSEQGFDFIKILSLTTKEQFESLLKDSKSNNIKLGGHCSGVIDFTKAINSGQYQSIEHLHGIFGLKTLDEIQLAIRESITNEVFYCPTVDWYLYHPGNTESFKKRDGKNYISGKLIKEWDKKIAEDISLEKEEKAKKIELKEAWFDYRIKTISYLYREGIEMLVGPDLTGVYGIPGFGYVEELKHFKRADMSNFDILRAATYNPAKMLGEELEWGTVRERAVANLILLKSNPLIDIENATQIEGIFQNGIYLTKDRIIDELNKKKKLMLMH
jgi:imidazolonepropionase-like amidohydrolase